LFDMGNTLLRQVRFDIPKGQARLLELAHNPRHVTIDDYEALAGHPDLQEQWVIRDKALLEFPMTSFDRLVSDSLGLTYDIPIEDVQIEFLRAAYEVIPEPGICESLAHLKSLCLPMGAVCNSSFSGRCLALDFERHGMLDFFRFIMSSADYGIRKPHPAIFRAAASKLGVAARDIWFIGDTLDADIAGALCAGMTAIWYCPDREACTAIAPHAILRHWRDLPGLLGAV
jgi:putative hydrolase of the HAD superfamily